MTRSVSFEDVVEQVRADLGSDTASLLLLDDSGLVLEPVASSGLGQQWRGATHVRVGAGFAGRVAADRAPVVVDDVSPRTVLNPVLRDNGVTHLLGVPVEDEGLLYGVLHVGHRRAHDFAQDELRQLQQHADALARRLSATSEVDEHSAALTLQRSLLPAAPPLIDGLDIAVRYLPAEGDLGGDWYDIFDLPGGRTGLVMGDVQGHGLRSAVIMGRLRSTLRAYALEHQDPATVLELVDRKLCHFENGTLATVAFAVTEPPFDRVRIALAGHPPPVVVRPGTAMGEPHSVAGDLLLGLAPDTVRKTHEIEFPVDTSMALYTDGLIDVRPRAVGVEDPYELRMQRIGEAFTPGQDAETACARIVANALGDDTLADDVALMVVRHTG